MKVFTPEQTAALLPYPALVAALATCFAEGQVAPLRHHHPLATTNEAATLLLMPAWAADYGCVKIANVTPSNAQRQLPTVMASVLVFDNHTGEHLAILDGATLTARRTAAASALAASALARKDAKVLLVVGAGRVGSELPAAFAAVRGIEQVLVWNRQPARGQALVKDLRAMGWQAHWCADLALAVSQADIVSCATLSQEPLLHGEWLKAGQHIDLIGAFTPIMREVDDGALQRASIYIDTKAALVEAGELSIPLASGAIQASDIQGSLYDLCQGRNQRHHAQEITLFKGVGNAVMDLAAASLAMESLKEKAHSV